MTESIETLVERHHGEWLAVLVTQEEQGLPVGGELLATAKSRWDIHMAVKGRPEHIYVFFAGPRLSRVGDTYCQANDAAPARSSIRRSGADYWTRGDSFLSVAG